MGLCTDIDCSSLKSDEELQLYSRSLLGSSPTWTNFWPLKLVQHGKLVKSLIFPCDLLSYVVHWLKMYHWSEYKICPFKHCVHLMISVDFASFFQVFNAEKWLKCGRESCDFKYMISQHPCHSLLTNIVPGLMSNVLFSLQFFQSDPSF